MTMGIDCSNELTSESDDSTDDDLAPMELSSDTDLPIHPVFEMNTSTSPVLTT